MDLPGLWDLLVLLVPRVQEESEAVMDPLDHLE